MNQETRAMQIMSEAEAEEAKKIRAIVERGLEQAAREGRIPALLREGFEIEFGGDSQGEPAVWIHLHITPQQNPSVQAMFPVAQLTSRLERDLLQAGLTHWPFVDIRPVS